MEMGHKLNDFFKNASRVPELPIFKHLSPAADIFPGHNDLLGFKKAQELALQAALEIARHIEEGWSERKTAELLNTWLLDNGVKSFFHYAYVWFGERTRFSGIRRTRYKEFMPTDRVLLENEVFILDVAPIVDGYICDIGYTSILGKDPVFNQAQDFLSDLKAQIPSMFKTEPNGENIWRKVNQDILDAGYDNIHALYPFSVLGHRIYKTKQTSIPAAKFLNFGGQSYWNLLSRGLFGQLLNAQYDGSLKGLWAIEPHIGTPDFGAKFEEILVVDDGDVYWLGERDL